MTTRKPKTKNEDSLLSTAIATIILTSIFIFEPIVDLIYSVRFYLTSPHIERSTYETRNNPNTLLRVYENSRGKFKQYKTTRVYTGYKFKTKGDDVYIINANNDVVDTITKSKNVSAYNYAIRNCGWGNEYNCDIDIKTIYTFKKSKVGMIIPSTHSVIVYKNGP